MKKVFVASKKRMAMGVILLALFILSGCVALAPVIETYRQLGVSSSDRAALLDKHVKDFHEAIYWGQSHTALSLADESVRVELREKIRDAHKNVKLIDSKIDFVEFNDDVNEAKVDVAVKYYKVPFYVVNEKVEQQEWKFGAGSGWKYYGTIKTEERNAGSAPS
jgi:hypothetical protein